MRVVVWIAEGTWPACVDATRTLAPDTADVALLHVTGDVPAAAHGAFAGLLGRGRPERDPGIDMTRLAAESAERLLDSAAHRLGRPCARSARTGRVEREVITAAQDADLLVLARDGDRSHLGPRSLGHATRFVVDHAPCPVLLVWPEHAPDITSLPPPPPGPRKGGRGGQ
ncbi:universal stress protein [Pseudonocardia sp. DLS-67]